MATPAPPRVESLPDVAFQGLRDRLWRSRVFVLPPLAMVSMVLLVDDAEPWRRAAVGLGAAVAGVLAAFGVRAVRRHGLSRRLLARLVPVPASVLGLAAVVSGGIDSPLFIIFAVVCVFLALFVDLTVAIGVAALGVALVWTLTAVAWFGWVPSMVPAVFGGGAAVTTNGTLLVVRATVYSLAIGWGVVIGTMLRAAYQDSFAAALAARDEVLKLHAESARTLTTLSAEIAHELKNPLASVKGLAQLLARDAAGKDQERLTVLRREVDRMQEILESFLTYSRPLVPLSTAPVALGDVARHVLALHEGVARERRVALTLDEERPVAVRADHRKLTQVLVNLVQNALDASPDGAAVEVMLRPDGDGARVEVRDRGPGVPEDARERVFDAGVTSKATGHGLGLTVARAIARQHGGALTLQGRVGGGAVAVLTLPAGPQEAA